MMCYDTRKWHDAKDAIIKSSLSTPKYCIMSDNLADHAENFEVPERPISIRNPSNLSELIPVTKHDLTYQFNLNEHVHCYLQFFIKCKKMVKTAGMGDTISATGFIYHQPK